MKIYTRRGDEGRTSLFGGEEISKDDPRARAYGTVDELNAWLGAARSLEEDPESPLADSRLDAVQQDLFAIGARLAAARPERELSRGRIPDLPSARVQALEAWIDELTEALPALDAFILPGGAPAGAQLHVARTVCRRAERAIVALLPDRPELSAVVLPYINRLSDLLFTLARAVNRHAGRSESRWLPVRQQRSGDATDAE